MATDVAVERPRRLDAETDRKVRIANRKLPIGRLASPVGTFGGALLAAVVLAALPGQWTDPLRDGVATALRPGQNAAWQLRRHADRVTLSVKSHFQTAQRLAEVRQQLDRLEQQNRRLKAELAAAASRTSHAMATAADDHSDRLLIAACVPARVLGRQARAFLVRHYLLDIGSSAGVEPGSLVVDPPTLIDRGRDAHIDPGQLVLAGGPVWGKIVWLGSSTSAVCAVTESGYRDLVRLGSPSGPQGILEGTGDGLPRIRLVGVTEPVSQGDPVYAADVDGVLPTPPLYGHVARLERPVGAAHWQIRMQPAVTRTPQRVAVLRIELNPLRVAGKGVAVE